MGELEIVPSIKDEIAGPRSLGFYDPVKTEFFRQAATELGAPVEISSTDRTRWVSSEKPHEPAIELRAPRGDLSKFWKRVAELEAEAAKKVG